MFGDKKKIEDLYTMQVFTKELYDRLEKRVKELEQEVEQLKQNKDKED